MAEACGGSLEADERSLASVAAGLSLCGPGDKAAGAPLPARAAAAAAAPVSTAAAAAVAAAPVVGPLGLRVLLVGGDADTMACLSGEKYAVARADGLGEALRELDAMLGRGGVPLPPLVLLDAHGQGYECVELLAAVKARHRVPVVVLAHHPAQKLVERAIHAGAEKVLAKPVQRQDARVLWTHVARYEAERHRRAPEEDATQVSNRARVAVQQAVAQMGTDQELSGYVLLWGDSRQRTVWRGELQRRFLAAVEHIGLEQATPKLVQYAMDVPSLSREVVSSHLQKYRKRVLKERRAAAEEAHLKKDDEGGEAGRDEAADKKPARPDLGATAAVGSQGIWDSANSDVADRPTAAGDDTWL